MKNITVALQDSLADWAQVWAASHHTSVSRLLSELLAEKMRAEEGYQAAMSEFFSVEPAAIAMSSGPGKPYPARESLHER